MENNNKVDSVQARAPIVIAPDYFVANQVRRKANPVHLIDTMAPEKSIANMKMEGSELFFRSVFALTIGIVPFTVSKMGELIVKSTAALAQKTHAFFNQFGACGRSLGYVSRVILGIPALIGGLSLFGGAVIFSKMQALAWGQQLIEHPQEERLNTQLARYGTTEKPWNDFLSLLRGFFLPSHSKVIDLDLRFLSDFKAT